MTDNLSNKKNQRIFGAEFPPKLNADYERLPEVANQIREVLRLSEAEFANRLAVNDFHSEKFLRAETLICLLSLAHAENLFRIENLIAERLLVVCRNRLRRILRNKSFDENFIEEMMLDIYADIVNQSLGRKHKSYDYWEVRFYKALTALVQNFLRKHSDKYRATALFSELSNEGETAFEEKLESGENFAREFEIKETSKKIVKNLPEDLRKIFILHYSDGETQKTIAEKLDITDRTVRTKLSKI
ncbi:MAG TPA: sigma-70 family RNA polymerase sigma factor, partial [Pyrinomonadaceae bacterium]|nr:sigma-70 family RNA polymerase sigma factor [Pyrinomonadaceae bacterium]